MASRQNASPVWAYFTRDGSKATCKDCKKIIGISGGSTSGLVKHLRLLHKIQLNTKRKGDVDNDATGSKKTMAQSVITSFVKQDRPKSLAEISASLMAVDGFSAHAISKSSYLRLSLSRDGYNLPKNPTDIISLMTKDYISPSRILLAAPCLAAVRLAARPPGRRPSSRRPPGRISHFNVVFCMVCVRLVLYNDIQRMHCPAKYNFCSYAYVRWIIQRSLSGRITHQRAMPGTV